MTASKTAKTVRRVLAGTLGLSPVILFAQTVDGAKQYLITESTISSVYAMLSMLGVILAFALLIFVMTMVKDTSKLSFTWLWDNISGATEDDELMDHEYDGIRELDNPMPFWLQAVFIGSIVVAGIYLLHYHVLGTGALQTEEYDTEMAIAKEKYKNLELSESDLVLVTDATKLETGKNIYTESCVACHGAEGQGTNLAPNLTDKYWKHGGDLTSIYNTITNGVLEKGMISWKNQISSQDRLSLSSYILELQGTNPADPKDPEGDLWNPDNK